MKILLVLMNQMFMLLELKPTCLPVFSSLDVMMNLKTKVHFKFLNVI